MYLQFKSLLLLLLLQWLLCFLKKKVYYNLNYTFKIPIFLRLIYKKHKKRMKNIVSVSSLFLSVVIVTLFILYFKNNSLLFTFFFLQHFSFQ
jgi:hypothetical protein